MLYLLNSGVAVKSTLSFFSFFLESQLNFSDLCLFSVAGQSVGVARDSGRCVLSLRVTAGHALRSRTRPFASLGQALLEALRGEVVHHRIQAAVETGQT